MINYAKKHPYFLSLILIIILSSIFFAFGYRIQPNLRINKNGTLSSTIPFSGTVVYIGNKKVVTTIKDNEIINLNLSTKDHNIILNKEGYLPWSKIISIKPETISTIYPFFISQNQTGQIITQNDPEYWSLRYKLINSKIPTEDSPRELNGTKIWVKDNTIFAKNTETFEIITPVDDIRSLDFYKDRSDVVIFASDLGVYSIEVVKNAPLNKANFFPIYKGIKPIFEKTDNSFLYVLDGENLMMVVI